MTDILDPKHINIKAIDQLGSIVNLIRKYHRHEVFGMDKLPRTGRCLVVVNHSLATYDLALLAHAIYTEAGRLPRSLMDRWFFKLDILAEFFHSLGTVEGAQGAAKDLLNKDELVTVAPGGMRESIRPRDERYQIIWRRRKGFVKLAIETGSPIVLAACPKADDIFEVYDNPITKFVYNNFRVPFVFMRGIGLTPLPRPVKLKHFLSRPLQPPKASKNPATFKKQVDRFHQKVVKEMEHLIGEAITHRD